MKIGVTTYYNYNYGSALQCYALQKYISANFAECVLIKKSSKAGYISKLFSLAKGLGSLCLKNPTSIGEITSYYFSQRSKNLNISKDSLTEINRFLRYNIDSKSYSWKELCKIALSDEYENFITGSDQVWNGCRVENQDFYFLRFAPKNKRIAFAPSFGGDKIAKYNLKSYKKYLNEFKVLSARENTGKELIKLHTNEEVSVICDPVCLFDAETWRKKYTEGGIPLNIDIKAQKYILAFFIDRPSSKAIDAMKQLQLKENLPIYSIGYTYKEFDCLSNYEHIDGSPWEFLKLIDEAETVLTDSFHATMFSLIFNKNFYVYKRCYMTKQEQSDRITNLLKNTEMISSFEPESVEIKKNCDYSKVNFYLLKCREKADLYLSNNLNVKKLEPIKEANAKNLLNKKNVCCGCGACAEICPKNAIEMKTDDSGAEYPFIDECLCVNCNKCVDICKFKKKNNCLSQYDKKFYVANSKNLRLTEKSSSAGMFAIIAQNVLKNGGIVFGAAVNSENGNLTVKHIEIDNVKDLYKIQGSKYVQSDTTGIFTKVERALKLDKEVLFSGTSCQVAQLKHFLKKEYEKLITVDLICHGVPGKGVLNDYVAYLEKKYNMTIFNIAFRSKTDNTPYVITIEGKNHNNEYKKRKIHLNKSSYLRLFMWKEAYRESCYNCQYSTINKPSDITLGDYYPDETEIKILNKKENEYLSFVMINTVKGRSVFEMCNNQVEYFEITRKQALRKHYNLRHASFPIKPSALSIYRSKGFNGLSKYIFKRNVITAIPKKILKRK